VPSESRSQVRHLALAVSIAGVAVLGLGAWFTHNVHTLEGYGDALCAHTSCASGEVVAWS
jgi:hypothetical protein